MTTKANNKRKWYKRFIIAFWSLILLGVLSIFLLFNAISTGKIGYIPTRDELQNPTNNYASQLISSDLEVLGNFSYAGENRTYTSFQHLSPYLVDALIATEDSRYYKHSGIDFYSLIRVLVKTVILGQTSSGGGSTISQQTSKLYYSSRSSNFSERAFQKLNEWVIATELEQMFSKEEIISMYFNRFDFLNNAVGIQTASRVYFGTTPDSLKLEQAAMLVGMCKNPSYFNPLRHPDRTLKRREVVLKQMAKNNFITPDQYDSIRTLPLGIEYNPTSHNYGTAAYFREYVRLSMTASEPQKSDYPAWRLEDFRQDSIRWENDPIYGWCNKNTKPDGEPYDLYADGLRIYSTLDSRIQKHAENAVSTHMKVLQSDFSKRLEGKPSSPYSYKTSPQERDKRIWRAAKQSSRYATMSGEEGFSEDQIKQAFNTPTPMSVFSWDGEIDTVLSPLDSIAYYKSILRSGFVALEPKTGKIKAYVGGINFKHFKYDMVTQGRRQVGSTFKPIVYALALQSGISPCTLVRNSPHTVYTASGQPWTPKNAESSRQGQLVTVKWGLAHSNNFITAWIMQQLVNPGIVVNMAHALGITSTLDPVVSIVLGPTEITLREMVSTFGVFVNDGIYVYPQVVSRITDSNGNILHSFLPDQREAISKDVANAMTTMLQDVVNSGTGRRLRYRYNFKGQIGGKTGTTQDNSDGWFIGILPRLAAGAWVGGEEREVRFTSIAQGQGANTGLPIFAEFLKRLYADESLDYSPDEEFEVSENSSINLDCSGRSHNKNTESSFGIF